MIETVPSKLYWLLGFFLCFGISWFFYKKEFFLAEGRSRLKYLLILLRTLSLFVVLFLCLDPFVSYQEKYSLKPELVVLVDDSKSISYSGITEDSLKHAIGSLKDGLADKVEVRLNYFGGNINTADTLSLKQAKTNLQKSFIAVDNLYEGKNIEAVVLLSDGIVNSGSKSKHLVEANYPVYTIGIGDTSLKKDLVLKHFYHNDKAIVGNEIPVRVEGICKGYRGDRIKLAFFIGGDKVGEETIEVNKDEHSFLVNKKIIADSVGIRKLTVRALEKKGEFTLSNNEMKGFIRVSKEKKKIQVLYADPHPDIAAFKSSVTESDSYEVKTAAYSEYNWGESVSLIVLFGMPQSRELSKEVESKLKASQANRLYFLNSKVDYGQWNSSDFVIEDAQHDNDVRCSVDKSFSLFDLSDESMEVINSYPPAIAPYGEYVFSRNFKTLVFQKVGKVSTSFPLICFNQSDEYRSCVIVGEGLWKWRLNEVMKDLNSEAPAFDEMFSKTLRFLTVNSNEDNIELLSKNIFEVGEKITLKAKVKNSIKESVKNLEVHALIKGEGVSLDLMMYGLDDHYVLDAGYLSAGEYDLTLSATIDGKKMSSTNKLIVKSFYLEQMVLKANHKLLREIAEKTGGKFCKIDKLDDLIKELNRKEYAVVSYFEFFTTSLMKFKWLLYCLIGLLGLEWFIRKWYGTI